MAQVQVPSAAVLATAYPLQTPVDRDRHYKVFPRHGVSDQNVWLQVTDIPIPGTRSTQQPSELLFLRFRDTEAEVKDFLNRLPPIQGNTARIYDHVVLEGLEKVEGHDVHSSTGIDGRLREHLSAETGCNFGTWNTWNVSKVSPVVDPYQTYVVRDQWTSNLQTQTPDESANKPIKISTYDNNRVHRTLLQSFRIQEDSLLILHLHELTPGFLGTTYQTVPNSDDTQLRMSLARQILQRNLIAHLHQNTRAEFVKVAILECLRQRIFLTTETWSTWLYGDVTRQGIDLDFEEAQSASLLLERRRTHVRLEASMEQLVRTMEYVMNSLETEEKWQEVPALKHGLLDLRNQCECGRASAKCIRDMTQGQWEQRQFAVEIKSAEDSARLTLLAAIFLPLSLSTSLLAMNTRLKNLHLLLYDFVGVVIILSGLAICLYGIVVSIRKLSRSAREQPKLQVDKLAMRALRANMMFLSWKFYGLGYVLIAVAFLVGMLKDITVGWKMLVYSIVGTAGLFVVTPVVIFLSWLRLTEAFCKPFALALPRRKPVRDNVAP